jgi:molecular chaperone GrpE (heat shock protein)
MSERLPEEEQVEEVEPVEQVDELAAVAKERDEYLDALQRLKAEFDNYRKRVAGGAPARGGRGPQAGGARPA